MSRVTRLPCRPVRNGLGEGVNFRAKAHHPSRFPNAIRLAGWAGIIVFGISLLNAPAVSLDDFITARMQQQHIPGLSLAIIQDGKIIKAKGYGFTDQSSRVPVTAHTLFLAGSVSKSVAAFGALRLVQEGQLTLDADVNTRLRTWKVPENKFTKDQKVTLREILSHSAGLTVHGFPGYARTASIPTLVQVLDGVKPANTPAIRVDTIPGSEWRYSGGGYTVMQQLMMDVTGNPFPKFMSDTVLQPLGMTNSTYEQPLPKDLAMLAATGYYASGRAVEGKWHVYPEMAAAGLWTTPSDLARFAIAIQQALAGKSNPVLSPATTRLMLTRQKANDGLGVFLGGRGQSLRFSHGGRDEGFDAFMVAYADTGQGAVIMINANDDSGASNKIIEAIAKEYDSQSSHNGKIFVLTS
ncbi:MAG TPA: serine hydrolase domain-containing protein [Candidatus Acidoferrales bacterium]|nr:serine hydrolase domain-containing protein [Candidatus Acidoferrales bacterium]